MQSTRGTRRADGHPLVQITSVEWRASAWRPAGARGGLGAQPAPPTQFINQVGVAAPLDSPAEELD